MLKLGGWPRLTWGRDPRGAAPIAGRCTAFGGVRGHFGSGARWQDRSTSTIHHVRPRRWPALRPAAPWGTGGQCPHPAIPEPVRAPRGAERRFLHDAQAGVPSTGWPRAQLAFKDSMVRGILQFTPGIAFRYVLHRCESLDIRCLELYRVRVASTVAKPCALPTPERGRAGDDGTPASALLFLGTLRGAGVLFRPPPPCRRKQRGEARRGRRDGSDEPSHRDAKRSRVRRSVLVRVSTMILPQVHLRKPCYDFSFL